MHSTNKDLNYVIEELKELVRENLLLEVPLSRILYALKNLEKRTRDEK